MILGTYFQMIQGEKHIHTATREQGANMFMVEQ